MPAVGGSPGCRFYIPPPYDSHCHSASPVERAQVRAAYPLFSCESPNLCCVALPDRTTGACPAATIPVYRRYHDGGAPKPRSTTSAAVKAPLQAQQWVPEGYGPNQGILCAPQ